MANGYRNPQDPDPFAEPGWFVTDDVGALDDSGVLRVLGRIDDAISTGGPDRAAATLWRPRWPPTPPSRTARYSGLPTTGWASAWPRPWCYAPAPNAPTVDELRDHVEATLARTAAPRELHIVDELPRRGIGKVDRRALIARFG